MEGRKKVGKKNAEIKPQKKKKKKKTRHNKPRAKGGDRRSPVAFRLRRLTLGFELRQNASPAPFTRRFG